MQKKVLGCLGIGAVILLVISVMVNVGLLLSPRPGGGPMAWQFSGVERPRPLTEVLVDEGTAGGRASGKKIARIDIDGVITNFGGGMGGSMTETTTRALKQAADDASVVAVLLRVNSPGGEVTASDVIYNAVRKLDAQKPVMVFMDSIAASGGYYIACGARHVMSNATAITGSIGVIIAAPNYTELMDKIGLDMMVFRSGAFKDSLRGSREMREDERLYWQAQVDEMYGRFLGIVAEARNMPEADLRNGIADGRVFSGTEALAKGLVDEIGYIEDAYAKVRELASADGVPIVRYRPQPSFGSLLGLLGESRGGAGEGATIRVDISERLLPDLQPGQIYLLPPAFFPMVE